MKLTKKLLSLLLAVLMLTSSISVCFSYFAASGTPTETQWQTLETALEKDAVVNAEWSGSAGAYKFQDTDGSVKAAVEAYFDVFNTLTDKNPSKDATNRTSLQINKTIRDTIAGRVDSAYANKVETFLQRMNSGTTVSAEEGNETTSSSSNLNDVSFTITVLGADLQGFDSVDDLPRYIYATKTYSVTNTSFQSSKRSQSSGCTSTTYYKYAYYAKSATIPADTIAYTTDNLKKNYYLLTTTYKKYFLDATTENLKALATMENASATLTTDKASIEQIKTNVVNEYGAGAWSTYFPTTSYDKAVNVITQALEVISYQSVIDEIEALIKTDYSAYTLAEMKSLYGELDTALDAYHALSDAVREILGYDTAKADEYSTVLLHEIELAELRALKVSIDAKLDTYGAYFADGIANGTVTTAMIVTAIADLRDQVNLLGTYVPETVVEVCGADYISNINKEITRLEGLQDVSEYYDRYMVEYNEWNSKVNAAVSSTDEATLLNALKSYDSWYAELKALVAEMEEALGGEMADMLMKKGEEKIFAAMENAYAYLGGIVKGQVDTAYAVYDNLKETVGDLTFINVNNYQTAKNSLGLINDEAYTFLSNDEGEFEHDKETVRKYNELKNLVAGLNAFEATKGLEAYIQQQLVYSPRPVYDTDIIKTEDYEVTEENLLKVIDLLDGFLTGENFEALAGQSLNDLLGGMVEDLIYSDSFINTIVNFLYPLIQTMFAKVLYENAYTLVENYSLTGSLKYSNIEIFEKLGLYMYPESLAKILSAYPQAKAALNNAAKYGENYYSDMSVEESFWKDPAIYDGEKLTLVWGVDDVKANGGDYVNAFYEAFGAAMSGLNPLLFALLCNKEMNDVEITKLIDLTIASVDLHFSANPNSGYANTLVPIFEALGIDSSVIRTDAQMKTYANNSQTSNVARAIFEPIFNLIDKVCAAPLDTVLNILPNLVYALETGMVMPLLEMLQVTLNYSTDANGLASLVGSIKINDNYVVNVGELVAGLEPSEDGGLDIGALLNDLSLESILELIGLPLPPLDSETIAYAGTMTTVDTKRVSYIYDNSHIGSGKAYHIEADQADLAYYILTYALALVKDETAFTGLLEGLMTQKDENGEVIKDADGNTIPDEEAIAGVTDIIDMLDLKTPGDVIAALVELLNMEKYGGLKDYTWYEGVINDTNVDGLDPALLVYLSSNNSWNEDTAEEITADLTGIIEAILATAGVKDSNGNPIKIADEMAVKYAGAFTNATITSLAKTLGGLFAKTEEVPAEGEAAAEEGIDVFALIKSIVGLDLSAFEKYADIADDTDWGFNDGDVAGFFGALAEIIAPFDIVVDFLFNNGELTLTLAEGKTVTLYGNDGYNTALIPLLEALGCKVEAGPEDTLGAVFTAVANLLEKVKADPVNTILEVLPSVLYYLESNALSVGVFNLLQPIYAVLDVIRPIIDKDLIGLIEMIIEMTAKEPEEDTEAPAEEGFDILEFITSLNLDDLGVNFVLNLLNDLLLGGADLTLLRQVIADVCKVIGAEYDTASTFVKDAKKGQYGEFSKADMVTVILSVLVDTLKVEGNAEKLGEAFGTDIIAGLVKVFEGTPTDIDSINWMYFFGEDYDFTDYDFSSGVAVAPTIESLEYHTNWTKGTAAYVDENLEEIVAAIIGLIGGEEAETDIGKLLNGMLVDEDGNHLIYNKANIEAILALLVGTGEAKEDGTIDNGLLGGIDAKLLEAAGLLLNADLDALKTYVVPEIKTGDDFAAALAEILGFIPGIVDWLLFGKNYELLLSADTSAGITIYGAEGYKFGLAPVLEALGVALPEGNDVEAVLKATFARLDAILADPVNEALDILPNIIYFINADGLTACVNNLLSAVYALLDTINNGFGANININELLGFNLADLSAEALFNLAQDMTGLDLSAAGAILCDLCVGKIVAYESVAGTGFKMVYNDVEDDEYRFARYDMITILATVILMVVDTEGNAEKLDELLGTDGIVAAIKGIITGADVKYNNPNWGYVYSGDELIDYAITYPNDWTADTAEYVYKNIDGIVAAILDMAGVTPNNLGDLLTGLLVKDGKHIIYNADNIYAIRDLVADLLGGIDETLITAAGKLLGADINAFATYEVTGEVTDGASFARELAGLLGTIDGLVDWLLFNDSYQFFLDETKIDKDVADYVFEDGDEIITINGAEGYAKGLALILEALGVDLTNANDVNSVLTATFARLDAILANPVDEIFNVLPNVIYFINAGGIEAAIDNLTAGLMALIDTLAPLGIELNLADLINLPELLKLTEKDADKEWLISIDNLSIDAIVEAVTALTGLDLSEAQRILKNFSLGEVKLYDSVSDFVDASKMTYTDEFSKRDMLTVLITTVLLVIETEGNAAALDELIGSDIITSILGVMSSTPVVYASPDWEYCWNGGVENGTVDVMKYAITYPNDWTEQSAIYVTENLPELGDLIASLIDSNYNSLSALIDDKLVIYSTENVQAIIDAIAGLLSSIDSTLIEAAGKLLDCDINGLVAYKAKPGIDTAEEFSAELTYVLTTYASGLVDWLLFGEDYRFFVNETGDIITINGAYGYAEGLALVLEALGCENLPEGYNVADSKATVKAVLDSLFARLDAILANPVDEVFNLLPNLLYFLNANGVAIAVDNLTAGLTALLDKLAAFGLELNLNDLIDLPALLGLEGDYKLSIDNLTIEAIIEAVGALTGLNLDKVDDVLTGFALGEVKEYDSVSTHGKTYKMYYNDEFAKYDMVTVLATLVLITIEDKANEAKLQEMLGEDIYKVIMNIFNLGEVPVQEFNWQFTDKADTDYEFSALLSSELYKDHKYGPLYTEEMAQYIADNFGGFVNNILYLLGIEINGEDINTLTDLLNGLINGGLYNSKNAQAIADALAGVVNNLEGLANGAGKYIIGVLKSSLGVDLKAYETMTFAEFDNDRAAFEAAILKIAEPIYPLLKWLLAKEDISFFVDLEKQNLITLKGAEGYAYGIIPLLEVLGCDNVMTKDAYNAAVAADDSVLITSILPTILDRLDVIIADPANEILEMLPNLIYFLNSNGVDTVVKNTLGAVFTVLTAIKPIADVDLYALIGLDLETLTFEKLFEMLLDMIADATGYRFENLDASAVSELTVGKLVSYTSANGKKAYKMVYASEKGAAEMVTVIMRLLITFIMHENNQEILIGLLKDNLNMSADSEKYVRGLLDTIADLSVNTHLGMDKALATLYYLFYGLDIGVGEVADGKKDLNEKWQEALKELGKTENGGSGSLGDALADFLDTYLEDVLTSEGLAPNGIVAFFQKIAEIFNKIIAWFKMVFGIEG